MKSIFNLALETADVYASAGTPDPTEEQSDAGVLNAAMEDHHEMQQHEKSIDELVSGQDQLTELVDVAAESFGSENKGLTKTGLRILKMSFKNIVGKNIANRRMPAMESADVVHPTQLTAIALEGINDTIKQFWTAIKTQMGKFWNSTKQWFIKTFDTANKIISRSKALEEKAGALATSATEKSFELGGASILAMGGQVKDPAVMLTGLENMKTVLDSVLDNITKENQNDKSDLVLDSCKNLLMRMRSQATKQNAKVELTPEELKGIQQVNAVNLDPNNSAVKITASQLKDLEMRKKLGVDEQQAVFESVELPGNRKLYRIAPTEQLNLSNVAAMTNTIKRLRFVLSDATSKPREMEDALDVKTLNASQMGQIAAATGDMGETILKYKKEFEARDRYLNKIVKGFDSIIKELDGTEVQHPAPKQQPTQPAQQQQQQPVQQQQPAVNQNGGGNGQAATTTQADGDEGDTTNITSPVSSVDKDIRKLSNAVLGQFKKSISLSGAVLTHSIKVANGFLNYGERSLAQYGS